MFNYIINNAKSCLFKNKLCMSTTTAFFRNLDQLNLIYDIMKSPERIYVFACSKGCEAYSLAMLYHKYNKGITPKIYGYDIDIDCISKAQVGDYEYKELLYEDKRANELIVSQFLNEYFTRQNNEMYRIKDDLRSNCEFKYGNILQDKQDVDLLQADIVMCQNMLIHLPEKHNIIAINNLIKLVRPGGILVIGGMRLPVRSNIMKKINMIPVTNNCREIHEAQTDLRALWDRYTAINRPYIAMPPFELTNDWEYRFTTIFSKPK